MNDFMNFIKKNRVKKGTWKDIENHKIYACWLGKELEYKKMEDWYKITSDKISKKYGSGLIKFYNGSPSLFLKSVFPEYEWLEWKFTQTSQHFWKDIENHKIYANWLGKELEYKEIEDWYKITSDTIDNNFGGGLIRNYYKGSPCLFLKSVFPEYEWLEWKFSVSPYHFWEHVENQKKYAIWLGKELEYKEMEDWYKITLERINNNFGGGYIIKKYNSSPSLFLKAVFPEYKWLEWKFIVSPLHFWENVKNHKIYAIWLGKELRYKKMEDWYGITCKLIFNNYGNGVLTNYYNGSPSLFLKSVFPEYKWLEWKFTQTNQHFWKDIKNHKIYAIWLGKELGYKEMEDWYKITLERINNNFGGGLVGKYYNSSPCLFINSVFPEYKWINKNFKKNYSSGQIEWLDYIKVSTPDILHVLNNENGEFKIPNSNYLADGYSKKQNCIYEYHGDYWHGNPKTHDPKVINKRTKTSYEQLYNKTLTKQHFCEKEGFIYKYIWESEWKRGKKALIILQKKYLRKINKKV